MNKVLKGIVVVLAIVGAFAMVPNPDYCTPERISAYTNVIISYQECKAFSRCVIEPNDIREFHDAQDNFRQCVIEISGEAQQQQEEST